MSSVQTVNETNFHEEVLQANQLVLVDFYATWCPPCQALAPYLDQLAGEFAGAVKIVKLNIDEAPSLARQFRIEGVPTLILFERGQPVDRLVGGNPAAIRQKLMLRSVA